jgi:hypothetical protein
LDQFSEGLYIPDVQMTFDSLAKNVKNDAFFREAQNLFTDSRFQRYLDDGDRNNFEKLLTETLQKITIGTRTNIRVGKTLDTLKDDFYTEYLDRKAGKSFKLWRTPFESLNAEIGGLYSSDVYGVMAESGRGKSYLTIAIVDELLRQGANVLVKSYELRSYLWLSRLISVISAREEAFKTAKGQSAGLPNKALLSGKLDVETEAYFVELVEQLNDYYDGTLYLQAKGDDDLTRSLDDMERELAQQPDIDAVVLDPFYGLADVYGKNANRTKGGAAEQAARRFERIVGEYDVVGMFAVQAQTEKQPHDDEGQRELKLPTRDQMKTSKSLLEVCTNVLSFDSHDGEALIGVSKGRNGAEGFELPLLALLDYGVLREFPSGAELPF